MPAKAQERLYLNDGRDTLVGYGDKNAAFLYAAEGDEIPDSAAEKFGLVDGKLKAAPAPKPKSSAPATTINNGGVKLVKSAPAPKRAKAAKEQKPAGDKEQKGGDNKGGGSQPPPPAADPEQKA